MCSEPAEKIIRDQLGREGGFVGKSVDELENEARTDFLTELLNRRGFDDELKKAYEHAKRHGEKLALVFVDADNFKGINSKYTRPGGDKVLKAIGRAMEQTFRQEDFLCRWGGDEFVVITSGKQFGGTPDENIIQSRLNTNLKKITPKGFDPNDLNVTVGIKIWDGVESLESLQQKVQDRMDLRK